MQISLDFKFRNSEIIQLAKISFGLLHGKVDGSSFCD